MKTLKNDFSRTKIIENKYSILVFLGIFILSLLLRLSSLPEEKIKGVFYALLNTALIYFIVDLILFSKSRLLAVIPFAIFLTLDISFLYHYGSPLNYGVIASICETDMEEVTSMLKQLLVGGIIVFSASFFLLYKTTGEMLRRQRLKPLFSIAGILVLVLIFPIFLLFQAQKKDVSPVFDKPGVSATIQMSAWYISPKYPCVVGDVFYIISYFAECQMFKELSKKDKFLPEGVAYDPQIEVPLKFVLIVGESAHREHMSVYGYDIETTPFLDSLKMNSDKVAIFDSVIAPASITREAIRLTFSYATSKDRMSFWNKKNIIDLANDRGYETYWISNQSRYSFNDIYSGVVESSASNNNSRNLYKKENKREDLDLIPVVENFFHPDKKQFFVLKLSGSHMSYSDRYDEIDTHALGSKGKTIEYDKSIHHTDRMISELFKILEKQKESFVILYYSDHAEKINIGHSMLNKYKDQYKIPLVLISDSLTGLRYSDYVNKYYSDDTKRLNSSNLIYFLGEIMGYSVADSLVEKAKQNTEYIYQVDGSIKRYSEIKD